jgi:hypothetical protein
VCLATCPLNGLHDCKSKAKSESASRQRIGCGAGNSAISRQRQRPETGSFASRPYGRFALASSVSRTSHLHGCNVSLRTDTTLCLLSAGLNWRRCKMTRRNSRMVSAKLRGMARFRGLISRITSRSSVNSPGGARSASITGRCFSWPAVAEIFRFSGRHRPPRSSRESVNLGSSGD